MFGRLSIASLYQGISLTLALWPLHLLLSPHHTLPHLLSQLHHYHLLLLVRSSIPLLKSGGNRGMWCALLSTWPFNSHWSLFPLGALLDMSMWTQPIWESLTLLLLYLLVILVLIAMDSDLAALFFLSVTFYHYCLFSLFVACFVLQYARGVPFGTAILGSVIVSAVIFIFYF